MPFGKPVPATKGGAVSTLVEYLISENETEKKFKLDIISVFEEKAALKAKLYKTTKFYFIKRNKLIDKFDNIISKILLKINRNRNNNHLFWKIYIIKRLKEFLLKNNYDKVVFENSGYLLQTLKDRRVAEKYKGKLFYHLHNDIPSNVFIDGAKQCKLILISEYLKNKIQALFGDDIYNQCYIVRNGFDCNIFNQDLSEKDRKELRHNLSIEDNDKIILFTGRLVADKGVDKLIDAFLSLNRKDCVLLIVGSVNFDSDETSEFEKQIYKKILLSKKIKMTGYIQYNEIWRYYKLADIALLPSVWDEPAGLTMIEACAAATPLITTKSGGIPEYIPNKLAIFLARDENLVPNIANSINQVLSNYDHYKQVALKASLYIKSNYSKEIFYNNFSDVILK